jgi:hypothetical protein
VIGKIIKWMEKGNIIGLIIGIMKVVIKMIRKMALAYLNGKFDDNFSLGMMVGNITEIGKMENNMEKENFLILRRMSGKKECGWKEKGKGCMTNYDW